MAGRMRARMVEVAAQEADWTFLPEDCQCGTDAYPAPQEDPCVACRDFAGEIVDALLASNEVIPFGAASAMVGEFAAERDRYREALEEIADPTSSAADAYAERSEWASGWRAGYRHAAEIARQALNPEESDSG